jgi:hypothetical protein
MLDMDDIASWREERRQRYVQNILKRKGERGLSGEFVDSSPSKGPKHSPVHPVKFKPKENRQKRRKFGQNRPTVSLYEQLKRKDESLGERHPWSSSDDPTSHVADDSLMTSIFKDLIE